MDIRNYAETIVAKMVGYELKEVVKNNGVKYYGISPIEGRIRPVVYVNSYYEDNVTIDNAVEDIKRVIKEHMIDIDYDFMADYSQVKDKLKAKLINMNNNVDGISAKKYGYEDLKIVPYVSIKGLGTITVTKQIAKNWDMTISDVTKDAIDNIKKDVNIISLAEYLSKNTGMPAEMIPDQGIYIITNKDMIYGAIASLFIKNEMKKLFKNGYSIIPSSVHECLAVPFNDGENLKTMIGDVNASVVSPEEVLSDHPYIFA